MNCRCRSARSSADSSCPTSGDPPSSLRRVVARSRARLEAPATDDQKALFQRAADLTGRALTDFVVSSAEETATRTAHEREVLTLSGLDRKVFLDALLNSPSPSKPSACAEPVSKRASNR